VDFGAHVDQLEALGLELRREGSDARAMCGTTSGDSSIELIDVLAEGAQRAPREGSWHASEQSRRVESSRTSAAVLEGRGVEVSWAALRICSGPMIWTTPRRAAACSTSSRAPSGRGQHVRIGLVGAGAIARRTSSWLAPAHPDVEVAVVCDIDRDEAAEPAALAGRRISTSWRRRSHADELDAVFVCTRTGVHAGGRGSASLDVPRGLSREAARTLARGRAGRSSTPGATAAPVARSATSGAALDLLPTLRAAIGDVAPACS